MATKKFSDEELAAYFDGNLSGEESDAIFAAMQDDDILCEINNIMSDQAVSSFLATGDYDFTFGSLQNPEYMVTADTLIENAHLGSALGAASNTIQQQYNDSCAIKSQQLIMQDFGIDVTEDQLVAYSHEQGWYSGKGDGTNTYDVGKLLEHAGIPCTQYSNANIFSLTKELALGHKVIVGVDSGELWDAGFNERREDLIEGEIPDHALIVAGIDTRDPGNIKVVVTDPGQGVQKAYPMAQFMDAWADSKCFMVSTDISVPETNPAMANFDGIIGHIDQVAGMDFNKFEVFADISKGITPHKGIDFDILHPIRSLVNAFFDVINGKISFGDIFHSYDFARCLDHNTVIDSFKHTLSANGLLQNNDWDQYAADNHIAIPTNSDYSNYLEQAIEHSEDFGDHATTSALSQQQMMMDYFTSNNISFYDTIQ